MSFFDKFRTKYSDGKIIGEKLAELDIPDIAEKEMLDAKLKGLEQEIERLNLSMQDMKFDQQKWWIKMRRKYNLATENIHYENGYLYEWEDK